LLNFFLESTCKIMQKTGISIELLNIKVILSLLSNIISVLPPIWLYPLLATFPLTDGWLGAAPMRSSTNFFFPLAKNKLRTVCYITVGNQQSTGSVVIFWRSVLTFGINMNKEHSSSVVDPDPDP
jgi:hypothetical protein